ncbi:pyruvate dehydrogenase E2 component (dihydrolipoamide acetyltransferase) [Bartonella sp. CDC_skunk]|uniref:pyruvate dehydrogenase complex dihydrolipoamide acetyltransferase n=1 Tax=unclassified Bartonella TaxID=2645622 RepID=UPI000999F0CB|nr:MULTISPECIES: pyruvate dehydrogenase complex dihydrolipoamide acetyltransferase [unclassified Bartonella]AQX21505.1 pyruvate dehydrogenase E2 component (dihydrolipoamide acetyltransferase) [Bartonella sp. CDC_skunk]AQX26765.1 pyruvate dehydrogenase E2 component (dihydrolipoamide acetyltransferase) [Bartonella sp. Raccoon60]
MPIKITMPALSPTMEEGNLSKWNIKEGDKVACGDVIAEIETDKATMEVEAIDEGTVAKIVIPAGTQGVKVNSLIVILAEEGEDLSEAAKIVEESSSVEMKEQVVKQSMEAASVQAAHSSTNQKLAKQNGDNRGLFASPLARRLAAQAGIDLSLISGTGPHKRIIKRDVEKALNNGIASSHALHIDQSIISGTSDRQTLQLFKESEYTFAPHDNMRKTIAKRLVASKQMVPHFYVTVDCELDALLELRTQLNAVAPIVEIQEGMKPAYKLSVNDMIIKAVALSLKAIPDANVSWLEDGMLHHKHCDVGVAVSVPNGLMVPIIRCAEEKSLSIISNEMKDLATRARERKLRIEEYQGGTTAVSNMGMYGIKNFSAIINPPHATIFAIGSGEKRAIIKDEALAIATVMSVTLSVDHRAIDGALAAEVAQTFKKIIENPLTMLI